MGAPFLAVFGDPPDALERVRRARWEYRYTRVDRCEEDPAAVFEFVAEIEVESADCADGEPGR